MQYAHETEQNSNVRSHNLSLPSTLVHSARNNTRKSRPAGAEQRKEDSWKKTVGDFSFLWLPLPLPSQWRGVGLWLAEASGGFCWSRPSVHYFLGFLFFASTICTFARRNRLVSYRAGSALDGLSRRILQINGATARSTQRRRI